MVQCRNSRNSILHSPLAWPRSPLVNFRATRHSPVHFRGWRVRAVPPASDGLLAVPRFSELGADDVLGSVPRPLQKEIVDGDFPRATARFRPSFECSEVLRGWPHEPRTGGLRRFATTATTESGGNVGTRRCSRCCRRTGHAGYGWRSWNARNGRRGRHGSSRCDASNGSTRRCSQRGGFGPRRGESQRSYRCQSGSRRYSWRDNFRWSTRCSSDGCRRSRTCRFGRNW